MGTIISRKRTDGTVGHTAQILIKRGGKIVHREAKTFERKLVAKLGWHGGRLSLPNPVHLSAVPILPSPSPSTATLPNQKNPRTHQGTGTPDHQDL